MQHNTQEDTSMTHKKIQTRLTRRYKHDTQEDTSMTYKHDLQEGSKKGSQEETKKLEKK